jgi:transcription antitermination factor NusG
MQMEERMTGGTSSLVEARWHALYTRHQHERLVAHALTGKGFDIFLPQYRAIHRWKDRRKELEVPLFPNYVFIQGGLDRMLNILTTPGVHSLVSWGGRPADIPQDEIDAVRRLVESPLRIQPHPYIKCGDRVRIKSGPLEGIEGILVRSKSAYRLVLSVEMLSRSAAVEVDASMVERVRGSEPDRRDALRIGTRGAVMEPLGPGGA